MSTATASRSKVFIHAGGAAMGGALRHLTNFLPALAKAGSPHEYTVLVRRSFPKSFAFPNVRCERLAQLGSSTIGRLAFDSLSLPGELRRGGYGAVVSLTNFGPVISPIPHIVFQRCPLYFEPPEFRPSESGLACRLRGRLAAEIMGRAAMIVTPSAAAADSIRRAFPFLACKRFATLYHGFDASSMADAGGNGFRWTGGRPLLFFPAHTSDFKGFRILFRAFRIILDRFKDANLVLTICEKDNPPLFREYGRILRAMDLFEHVHIAGNVPQDRIASYYRAADLMIYPSLCESFGFTLLEAMGTGLPIVAADRPVNREIAGAAARYYPPFDDQVCAGLAIELLEDAAKLAALRSEGSAVLRSRDWSWSRYAREFSTLVDSIL